MTIRQLAETAGCGINTVRRVSKAIFPGVNAAGKGLPIDYDEVQSKKIMDKLPKRTYISDPYQMGTQMGSVELLDEYFSV